MGIVYIFAGLIFTGDFLDFLTVLLTKTNIEKFRIIGLINSMWFPGVVIFAMYFGAELIMPKKKFYIFSIYLVLSIIFELFLFLDPSGSITYDIPSSPGKDLINDNLVFESIPGILVLIFLLSILIFDGFGFLLKSVQSTGVIRRKFLLLALGAFLYLIGGILDGLFSPGIYLIFIRSGMVISALLFYLGVRA